MTPPSSPPSCGAHAVVAALVVVLLGQMALLMFLSAERDSPTFDEPAHLAAGFAYAELHDLRWNVEHPPLLKVMSGWSMRLGGLDYRTDTEEFRTTFQYGWGRQLLYAFGNDPDRVLRLARAPLIALSVCFGLVVFGFARDLFGARAALVPLALYSLCVDVLAHGRLVTTDVGSAGFFVLSLWLLYRARSRPVGWIFAAAVAFGLALSSKFTMVLLAPAFAGLVLWSAWSRTSEAPVAARARRAITSSMLAALVAVATVWGIYFAASPDAGGGAPEPQVSRDATGPLAAAAGFVPMPTPYRYGLRYVLAGAQQARPAFLNGDLYRGGRPTFYPVALSMKTPLGILALWLWAAVEIGRRRHVDAAVYVALPAGVQLAIGMVSDYNIGVRHVLPTVVLSCVATGVVLDRPTRRATAVAAFLVALAALSSWRAFPTYLGYVNEAWGGPTRAYELVTDSNVDWGQDLHRLAAHRRKHPVDRPVFLEYFGQGNVEAYGIEALDGGQISDYAALPEARVYVSVTLYNTNPARYAALGEPTDQVGNSILVFDIEPK